jgi:N6-L-threonylcarbamoyladenine synthase
MAWHLSGGTTELLLSARRLRRPLRDRRRTRYFSAGPLARAGGLLGLRFPSGRELDALAQEAGGGASYKPKLDGLCFSLSGVEHKMKQLAGTGASGAELAYFTVMSVVRAVGRTTRRWIARGPCRFLLRGAWLQSLCAGAAGRHLRSPACSADNALGAAILTYRAVTDGTENI